MSAYVIVQVDIKDPDRYAEYRKMVPPSLEPYGGRFIVRGGALETLEGSWSPARLVVLEFDDVERAKAWLSSEEYREARALRQATAETEMIVVEGV